MKSRGNRYSEFTAMCYYFMITMKNYSLLLIATLCLLLSASQSFAQGGMGKMPREDVVMISQVLRDSLSDEMFARLVDLKKYSLEGNMDSAAGLIAFDGGAAKNDKWSRVTTMSNPEDAARVKVVTEKLKKLFTDFNEMHQQFFAVFKNKDTPAGKFMLYQIDLTKGSKKRMVSFKYFPVGDKLLFGEAN